MIGGFQPLAFQPAFQQSGAQAVTYSGGWLDLPTGKRRTKAQIRADREQWGVLPKKAKAIIKRVAVQQAPDTSEADTNALIAAFNRAELAYEAEFAVLLQREIDRRLAMMREEEEIFLLLH